MPLYLVCLFAIFGVRSRFKQGLTLLTFTRVVNLKLLYLMRKKQPQHQLQNDSRQSQLQIPMQPPQLQITTNQFLQNKLESKPAQLNALVLT